jgi:hypothetical protein
MALKLDQPLKLHNLMELTTIPQEVAGSLPAQYKHLCASCLFVLGLGIFYNISALCFNNVLSLKTQFYKIAIFNLKKIEYKRLCFKKKNLT